MAGLEKDPDQKQRGVQNFSFMPPASLKDRLEELVLPIREVARLVDRDKHASYTLIQAIAEMEKKHDSALRLLVQGDIGRATELVAELEAAADTAKDSARHDHALEEETR